MKEFLQQKLRELKLDTPEDFSNAQTKYAKICIKGNRESTEYCSYK